MSARNIHRLERRVASLQKEANLLQNNLDLKNDLLNNNLSSVMQAGFPQSDLTSFAPIAYNNIYATLTQNPMLLTFFYKTHGIMQSAIDMPVEDALRGGLDFEILEYDLDDVKALAKFLETMNFYHTFKQAEIWAWVYGGSGLIVNDGTDPAKPLDVKKLYGKPLSFYAANRWELSAPNRFAETYSFYGQSIHGSRVITMIGKDAPYILKQVVQNWGMSRVENLVEPLNIYLRTQNAVYDLLKEAKVDVFKFKNFAQLLATAKGEQQALKRIQVMNMAKSNNNAVVMDSEDEFEQKQMTFSGLAQIWQENRISLASHLRMPMTKLFGLSASGFSSGEDDIENYNAMIESDYREHMKPALRTVLDMIMINQFGEVPEYTFKFKPLRMMSSVDEETVKTSKHNRYRADLSIGALTQEEYGQICVAEGLVPIETEVSKGAEMEPLNVGLDDGDEADIEEN